MADVDQGPILLAKKFGGLVLVFLGMIAAGFGYEYDSDPLMATGAVAIIVGAGLLALKVVRRNPN